MTDQTRADFESHFALNSRQQMKRHDGTYFYPEIQAKWEGYLAGVAKAAQERDTLAHGGMQAAAEYIDAKADKYLQDYAHTEGDTGATVFHYGEAGREYHSSLVELAEELRAQLAAAAPGADDAKDAAIYDRDTHIEQLETALAGYKAQTETLTEAVSKLARHIQTSVAPVAAESQKPPGGGS